MKDTKAVLLGEFDSPQAMDDSMRQAKLVGQTLGRELTFSTKHQLFAIAGPNITGKQEIVASDFSGPFDCRTHQRHFRDSRGLSQHRRQAHASRKK